MKNFKKYLIEAKIDSYSLKPEEEKKIDSLFTDKGFDTWACADLAKSCKNKVSAIRLWLGIILKTNSYPYRFKDTIISFPSNLGKELVDAALKKGATTEEIYYEYDIRKDNKEKTLPKKYEEEINNKIDAVLSKLDEEYIFELHLDDLKYLSDKGKELLQKRNGMSIIPFTLIIANKKIECEIAWAGNAYYHYRVEDKNFTYSNDFYKEIQNKIK